MMKARTEESSRKLVRQQFLSLTVAETLSTAVSLLAVVVDGMVTGKFLGPTALAALGIVTPVTIAVMAVAAMMTSGLSTSCASCIGMGDINGVNRCFSFSVKAGALFSLAMMLACFFAADGLAGLLGAAGELRDLAASYLRVYAFGMPAVVFNLMLYPVLYYDSDRSRVVVSSLVMAAVNIVVDLAVGLSDGELWQMALASVLSYYVGTLLMAFHFRKPGCLFSFSLRSGGINEAKHVLRPGLTAAVQQLSRTLLVLFMNMMILRRYGDLALSAYTAVISLASLLLAPGAAMGSAVLSVGSMLCGERDWQSLRALLRESLTAAVVFHLVFIGILELLAPMLAGLYVMPGSEAGLGSMTRTCLMLFIPSILFSAVNAVLRNLYLAEKKLLLVYQIMLLSNFVCVCAAALLLNRLIGLDGIWLSYLVGGAVSVLFLFLGVTLRSGKKGLDALLFLRDSERGQDQSVSFRIETPEEMADAAAAVQRFTAESGAPERVAMIASLCVEELAGNTLRYAFRKTGRSRDTIHVRAVVDERRLILRIRDNCPAFDPVNYLRLCEDADPAARIGIRMALGMAEDVRYLYSLHTNQLIVTLPF